MAKQKNTPDAPRQRGRPKKEGQLKESSVRIRPALKERLEAAAAESGESIARELEERLEATFTEVPRRGVTHELLQSIALTVKEIEAKTGKPWDKDLTTWAMLREQMANGPIADAIPHPDPAKARNLVADNAQLAEMQAERRALLKTLQSLGIEAGETALIGSAWLASSPPTRAEMKAAIEGREDLPPQFRDALVAQIGRLEELDTEIERLGRQVKEAMLPYIKAREAAREYIYGMRGTPDLPTWLMQPAGMNEPPVRRPGMFGSAVSGAAVERNDDSPATADNPA